MSPDRSRSDGSGAAASPAPAAPTNVDQAMQRLVEKYVERLEQERPDVEAAGQAVAAAVPGDRREALSALRFLAHRLAGSGATFGFRDLSTTAAAVEQSALDALAAAPAGESHLRAVADAVAALLAAIERTLVERRATPR